MPDNAEKLLDYAYQTEAHSIDSNTLILSQLHFARLITEVKDELYPVDISAMLTPCFGDIDPL